MSEQSISWLVELAVKPGQLRNFSALTKEMIDVTSREHGALVYERYISKDSDTVYVYERYLNSAAAMAHLRDFAQKFGTRFSKMIDRRQFIVFGSPSDELRAILDAFKPTYFGMLGGFAHFSPHTRSE